MHILAKCYVSHLCLTIYCQDSVQEWNATEYSRLDMPIIV